MNITEFRKHFVDINRRSDTIRYALGHILEEWVIETMKLNGVEYKGHILKDWQLTSHKEDKNLKRDAYCECDLGRITTQIKARMPNSGSDIGIATIQPKPSLHEIIIKLKKEGFAFNKEDNPKMWARDVRFDGDFFVCLENPNWERVAIIPAKLVLKTVKTVLKEWISTGEDLGFRHTCNTFHSKNCSGVQLKCTRDKSSGYAADLSKLITYIPANYYKSEEISFIKTQSPSDSLIKELNSIFNLGKFFYRS